MKTEPIITSIIDTDLYKFTMQNAVLRLYPNEIVRYALYVRNNRPFPDGFAQALKIEIYRMADLRLRTYEKKYMQDNLYFLPPSYVDFLSGYSYNPDEVSVKQEGSKLEIIIEGYWYRTILWEVPTMAIISELYYKLTGARPMGLEEMQSRNTFKAKLFAENKMQYCDMGTRRRFSFEVQSETVKTLKDASEGCFFGTSNPLLAMQYGLKAVGTQGHEWTQFHAAKYGFVMANQMAMEDWVTVYQGDLGYALPDTYTTDVFLRDFNLKYAMLHSAVRQDSGDPLKFVDKIFAHYKKLRIDPESKTAVFSDSLNFEKALRIHEYRKGKIKDSYGIGTWLSNDVGVEPLNMVIKLSAWMMPGGLWIPTVKLSDDVGKYTGDETMINLAKQTLHIA